MQAHRKKGIHTLHEVTKKFMLSCTQRYFSGDYARLKNKVKIYIIKVIVVKKTLPLILVPGSS